MADVTLRFLGDAKSLKAASEESKAALKSLQAQAAAARTEFQSGELTQKRYKAVLKELAQEALPLRQRLAEVAEATAVVRAGAEKGAVGIAKFGGSVAQVQKELAVLGGELLRGNFTRFEQSMVVLARQTGALGAGLAALATPLGIAGLLIGGFAIAAIVHFVQLQERTDAFTKSLESNRNAAGTSVQTMLTLSDSLQKMGFSTKDSDKALISLSASGHFFADAFEQAAIAAGQFAQITGTSLKDAVKEFEKLGQDPVKGLIEITERINAVNPAIVDMVAKLQAQGNALGATELATKAAADATQKLYNETVKYNDLKAQSKQSTGAEIASSGGGPLGGGNYAAASTEAQYFRAAQEEALKATEAANAHAQAMQHVEEVANAALASSAIGNAKEREELEKLVATYGKGKEAMIDYETQHQKMIVAMQIGTAAFDTMNKLIASGTSPLLALAQTMVTARQAITEANAQIDLQRAGMSDLAKKYDAAKEAAKHHKDTILEEANAMQALTNFADQLAEHIGGPLVEAEQKYQDALKRADELAEKALINGNSFASVIDEQNRARANALAILDQTNVKLEIQQDVQSNVNAAVQQEILSIGKSTVAKKAEQIVQTALNIAKKAGADTSKINVKALTDEAEATLKIADATNEASKHYDEMMKKLEHLNDTSPFAKMVDELRNANAELEDAKKHVDILGQAKIDKLQDQMTKLKLSMASAFIGTIGEALKGIQSLTKAGSKEYEEMRVAIDALAIAQAVLAVIHQGTSGDPYSAFARMAAMVAAVAPLLADIGASISSMHGSSTTGTAASVQATQGTGTVLGDATKQSESISKAIQITADATSKLVGISTGMLDALRSLQQALGGAANMLAHGAGSATFDPGALTASHPGLPTLPFTGMDKLNSILFGGSKKVIDQGISVLGGLIGDLLHGTIISAYETIKKSGGLFGSDKVSSVNAALSDPFNKQMQLVLGSIVDTVTEAAKALGIPMDDIKAKIAAFHVAEQKISLQGLSADDQQKALEAVFSSIFDGLAGAVVPFIAKFQKVGEGLGETLVRVATEVQVTQQAMKQLGLAIKTTDPEKFAQIADGLIQMTGGIDAFIDKMNAFTNDFAPDSFKFQTAKDALVSGLGQVGLTLPATREGFFELMQSLDASTEAGQKQIATLLNLTDAANTYYSMLDKQQQDANQVAANFRNAFQQLVTDTQNLSTKLFGTSADQIQAKIDALLKFGNDTGIYDLRQLTALKKQLADQQAQQEASQKLSDATALLTNLGKLGAFTGQNLQQLAQAFNIPLDQFAKLFGTDQTGLQAQYQTAVDTAKAALDTATNTDLANKLLANILAAQQGKPLPYSDAQLNAAQAGVGAAVGTKPGGAHGYSPPNVPGAYSATPMSQGSGGSKAVVDATTTGSNRVADEVASMHKTMRQFLGMSDSPRGTRLGTGGNGLPRRALAR
jgi:hypothetical protein